MRSPSQDLYFIEKTDSITGVPTWATPDIGLDDAVYNLVPTNKPDILSGVQILDTRKAVGISERRTGLGYEYTQGTKQPACNGFTVDMTRKNLGAFIWLLMQTGCSESDTTPFKITVAPYTDHVVEAWCALGRLLDASTESHYMLGAIISSLTISGTEGGVITMSADFLGADFDDSQDLSSVATAIPAEAPVLFQELSTITLGGDAIDLISFEITINNNATRRFYDSATAEKINLGDLDISGSFVIPWDQTNQSKNTALDAFIAGTDLELILEWPTALTNGITINTNMRYNADPALPADSNEHTINCNFTGVSDGTNDSFGLTVEDTVDRVIT